MAKKMFYKNSPISLHFQVKRNRAILHSLILPFFKYECYEICMQLKKLNDWVEKFSFKKYYVS